MKKQFGSCACRICKPKLHRPYIDSCCLKCPPSPSSTGGEKCSTPCVPHNTFGCSTCKRVRDYYTKSEIDVKLDFAKGGVKATMWEEEREWRKELLDVLDSICNRQLFEAQAGRLLDLRKRYT